MGGWVGGCKYNGQIRHMHRDKHMALTNCDLAAPSGSMRAERAVVKGCISTGPLPSLMVEMPVSWRRILGLESASGYCGIFEEEHVGLMVCSLSYLCFGSTSMAWSVMPRLLWSLHSTSTQTSKRIHDTSYMQHILIVRTHHMHPSHVVYLLVFKCMPILVRKTPGAPLVDHQLHHWWRGPSCCHDPRSPCLA